MAFQQQNRPFISLTGIIGMIAVMLIFYFVLSSLFQLLWYVGPVLLLITLFINHNVVLNYGKWILRQFQEGNWLPGLGATALTVFAFPLVSAFLFGKAMLMKKVKEAFPNMNMGEESTSKSREPEFTDYEEVEEDTLELPDLPKDVQEKIDRNEYDDLF